VPSTCRCRIMLRPRSDSCLGLSFSRSFSPFYQSNAKLLSKLNRPTATLGQINHPTLHSSHGNLPLVRTVVWVRSNLVAYAVGIWRKDQLVSGPCNSHNQKSGNKKAAHDCKLPASNVTLPLSDFVKKLKMAQFLHAINLGIAYRHWKPTAPVPQGTPCVDDGAGGASSQTSAASMPPSNIEHIPIYELYYEDMLRDKAGTMKALLTWLGVKDDLPVPKDKVVKSTPATLRGLLQNFDEIRAWLSDHSQCLLAHLLDPKGTQVMPPCPFFFNPEEDERDLFFNIARRKMVPDSIPTSVATGTRDSPSGEAVFGIKRHAAAE